LIAPYAQVHPIITPIIDCIDDDEFDLHALKEVVLREIDPEDLDRGTYRGLSTMPEDQNVSGRSSPSKSPNRRVMPAAFLTNSGLSAAKCDPSDVVQVYWTSFSTQIDNLHEVRVGSRPLFYPSPLDASALLLTRTKRAAPRDITGRASLSR
jgi:hypothetical protein